MSNTRMFFLATIAMGMMAIACSAAGEDSDFPKTQLSLNTIYIQEVPRIVSDVNTQLQPLSIELNSIVEKALENLTNITDAKELIEALENRFPKVFSATLDFVPRAIAITKSGADRIEALVTPVQFETDEKRYLVTLDKRIDLLRELEKIAEEENVEAFLEFSQDNEQETINNALHLVISQEFRILVDPDRE